MNNYVIVRFNSISANRLINKLYKLNISIYNISCSDNNVFVKISYNDYLKMQKYLKTLDYKVEKYYGKIAIKLFLKKYNLLILAFFISLIIIIFNSFLIVDINIIHEDSSLVSLIENDLEKYGIKKFMFKKSYKQLQEIKNNIKNNHLDKIEWLEINKVGMKYIIRVEERIINENEHIASFCNVYATKDGIIKSIKTYDGVATVEINDYVKKDDLLIGGDVYLNENIVNKVCATGDIYAEIWYTVHISMPLKYAEKEKTDKKRNNYIINFNGIDYKIFKDRLKQYSSDKQKIFDLLGIKIYKEKQTEVTEKIKNYTEKEAIDKALELANEKVKLKIGKSDTIISQKVLQNSTIDSTMELDIFIITEENIGYRKEIKEDSINGV